MATEVRRREALRPGDLGYAHTDKSIDFLPKLPPAGVFEIFFKSKQSFRNFFNCTNRLRYDREKALQSVTILSHRSNLVSNTYPSNGPRGLFTATSTIPEVLVAPEDLPVPLTAEQKTEPSTGAYPVRRRCSVSKPREKRRKCTELRKKKRARALTQCDAVLASPKREGVVCLVAFSVLRAQTRGVPTAA